MSLLHRKDSSPAERREWWQIFLISVACLLLAINTIGAFYLVLDHGSTHAILDDNQKEDHSLSVATAVEIQYVAHLDATNAAICAYLTTLDPHGPPCPPPFKLNLHPKGT